MLIPLWQNNDEIEHFAYTYYIVEENELPITHGGSHLSLITSDELTQANKILESDKISFGVFARNQIIHQDFNNILSNNEIKKILADFNRKNTNEKYLNATANYPPLYYYLEAIPYKIFQNQAINTRAYAMRIFSILFMLITVFYSFKLAQFFFKKNGAPYLIAILIGFLPRFSFTSTGINNDALVIAISTMAIYYLFKFLNEKLDLKVNLILGVIFGIGLLSKPQFYIFFLFLLIFYLYKLFKEKNIKTILISGLTVLILAIIISSGWYWFLISNHHSLPTNQVSGVLDLDANNQTPLSLSSMSEYVFLRYLFLTSSYFGMVGCCHEISLAPLFQGIFFISIGAGLFGYMFYLFEQRKILKDFKKIFLLAIPVFLELAYLAIYLRQPLADGGVDFPIDGRYLYPVISCLTIIFIIGLQKITPKKTHRYILIILIMGIIYINFHNLIFGIIPRYYL